MPFLQNSFIKSFHTPFIKSHYYTSNIIFYTKKKVHIIYRVVSISISLLAIITVFSFVLKTDLFNNPNSIYSFIFWPIYVINAFVSIYFGVTDEFKRKKAIFLLIVGGVSAAGMLMSPIYGARSSLYLIYYLIVVSLVLIEDYNAHKTVYVVFILMLLFIIGDRTHEFISKYKLVGIRQEERMEVIKYYQEHPEDEEAWIPRFSIYSIHGADVEPDDTYHLETFKEYFKLPQAADKIVFYFVED